MLAHSTFPADVRIARETRAAVEAGFNVDILCLRAAGEAATETTEGADVRRLRIGHRHGAGPIRVVFEYLGFTIIATGNAALRGGRYDVVQVHNPPDFLILAALIPKMFFKTRIVFDVHDLSPDMFQMRFAGLRGAGIVERVLRFIERGAARLADRVVTVHEPYREELAARGIPKHKIDVVMNSVDESLLPADVRPPDPSVFRLVYHGTITPNYGVELLVAGAARASNSIPNLSLEIYGLGDAVPAVEEQARRLDFDDRLLLTPHLPQREVLQRVAGASAGVVPNLPTRLNKFALSTKLFEYVALGIPVVCANLPTLQAHFSGDEVLFFEAGDELSLRDAIDQIAHDPEAAATRAKRARRRYEAYRWSHQAERYARLLIDLQR
jgi:glycosyltransferase involved in cell wall biosynthesis